MSRSCLDCTHCKVNISAAFPVQYQHWKEKMVGEHIKWVLGDYKHRKKYDIPISLSHLNTKWNRCPVRCAKGEWLTTKGEEKRFMYPKAFITGTGSVVMRYKSKAMDCEYFDGEEESNVAID